jgi:hypothetical protein
MTHQRKLLIGYLVICLALVAAGWWWYARSQALPFKMVLRGSSSYANTLGVSGGSLFVVAPKPGVFFGTVTKPGSQEQFTYLILFKYGRPKAGGSFPSLQFHCTSDGTKAESKDAIELDGKRIEAAYHIELNENGTAVVNEGLTIGGKSADIKSGQVFLVDMTSETPVYQQKNVQLPAIPSKLESTQDVEQLADAIRKNLESQDPEIQAFLR